MSAKLKLLCAVSSGVVAALAAGCQTYDFEPVEPLAIAQTTQGKTVVAKQLKPNMMLLVDKSGSMNFAADPSVAGCATCASSACTATCPRTRMTDLRQAMSTFLTGSGTVARMGLMFYPSNSTCGSFSLAAGFPAEGVALNQSVNDVDAELQATAAAINDKIMSMPPVGGTPTGASLAALGTYGLLQDPDRQDFVLLLTDGAPNCNESLDRATCICTATKNTDGTCPSPGANQCLDKDGTVAAVAALKAKGIETIVVGFGAEAAADSGNAFEVLTAAALAGGMDRRCPDKTDAECGGVPGSCDIATGTCANKYYRAADGPALTKALAEISILVGRTDPCEYKLDATPSDEKFLTVLIDGVTTGAGADTWSYASGKVLFQGALCQRLSNATPIAPVKVEFRIVEGL